MQSAILKSTFWSLFQRYFPSVLQILATLIITRKITPSDFGEVALVTTFYQIAILLVSSGLGDGLIYKCQCSSKLLSSVFYFNIFVALILYAIFYLTSSNIASFYGIVRLSLLMKIIGVNILIYSISFVQRVILQKQLRFKFLAITSLLSTLLGSILGICLAYHGYGVWSIVFMTLSVNFIESIIIWLKTAWYPSLLFSWFEVTSILAQLHKSVAI